MSLSTRLAELITAIGADVKELKAKVATLTNEPFIDGGTPTSYQPESIIDGGAP